MSKAWYGKKYYCFERSSLVPATSTSVELVVFDYYDKILCTMPNPNNTSSLVWDHILSYTMYAASIQAISLSILEVPMILVSFLVPVLSKNEISLHYVYDIFGTWTLYAQVSCCWINIRSDLFWTILLGRPLKLNKYIYGANFHYKSWYDPLDLYLTNKLGCKDLEWMIAYNIFTERWMIIVKN